MRKNWKRPPEILRGNREKLWKRKSLGRTFTGIGISPENVKRLFQLLFTTKARGIGPGLAVSMKLAEANGGTIKAESQPGVRTIFAVSLPLAGADMK